MLTERVAKGMSWLAAGRLTSNAIGMLSTIVVARLLMPEDFGVVALATSVLMIVGAFVELPTSSALIQLKELSKPDFDTAWTLGLIRGLIVCLVMVLAAWPVSLAYGEPRLIGVMLLLAIYPLILGLYNSYFDLFAREMQFDREVFLDVSSKLASFVVTVAVAYLFRTLWALPAGMIAASVVTVLGSFLTTRKLPGVSLESFRRIFNFSAWLTLSNMVNQLNWQSHNLIIGRMLGPATLGQTSVGSQFATRIEQATRLPLYRSLFSAFSQIQTDKERLERAYLSAQAVAVACLLPVGLGLGAVAKPAVLLVLGEQWDKAALAVSFFGPIIAMLSLGAPAQPLAMAVGRPRMLFMRELFDLMVIPPCLIVGLLLNGLLGGLIGFFVGGAVMLLVNMSIPRRLIGVGYVRQFANVARSLGAGAGMYATVRAIIDFAPLDGSVVVRAAALALIVAVGVAVYLGTHFVLWMASGYAAGPERTAADLLEKLWLRCAALVRRPPRPQP